MEQTITNNLVPSEIVKPGRFCFFQPIPSYHTSVAVCVVCLACWRRGTHMRIVGSYILQQQKEGQKVRAFTEWSDLIETAKMKKKMKKNTVSLMERTLTVLVACCLFARA